MIVCVCRNVSEKQLAQYLEQGDTPEKLISDRKVCDCCQRCKTMFDSICHQFLCLEGCSNGTD